jgi:hypothetical protein
VSFINARSALGGFAGVDELAGYLSVVVCDSGRAPRSCCPTVGNMGRWFDQPSSLDTSDHTRVGDVLVKLLHIWP